MPIQIDDPGRLLAQHEGKTPGAHLLVGVAGSAPQFHPARVVSTDVGGRTYETVIPYSASVRLMVSSTFFQLSDSVGLALARTGSAALPVTVLPGQQAPVVKLVVTGKIKQ